MLKINILDDTQLQTIAEAGYRLLETVGVEVQNAKALQILKKAGCSVEERRVKIPRSVVAKAVQSAPTSFQVYDREGNEAMNLGGFNSYYGAGPTCPNYFDSYTGERRPARKSDAAEAALVADALPNIDYAMSLVMVGDQTRGLADLHEVDAMLRNTTKPIATWAFNGHNAIAIIEMAAAVAGSLAALQENPFLIVYAEPTTPLMHGADAMDKVMVLAENRIPCIYTPGMLMGATAPVTLAGAMSVGAAECLTGLVVHQMISPGAPFIAGCAGNPMDMQHMKTPYGSPESILIHAASGELWRYLGIPSFGLAGAPDTKTVDAQAGFETAMQVLISGGCGSNLIHDVGFMDYGLTGSSRQLVFGNEVIGHARRLMKGIDVDEEHLAYEVVKRVGPGGNFLGDEHTFAYFRKEIWTPQLSERRSYEEWEADGKKDLETVVGEKLIAILSNHKPSPLSSEVAAKLDAIVAREEKNLSNQ
ncbi:MAG TPA: trimethylamine methyltransferase family protein [Clostridiales bacterium]|nr:trimethylamine methyltransferase family protein [Clostridiales bacterium]